MQLQGVNNFGRVEDAVIDDNGAIAYLVVSSNGQNVMLPWSEANFNFGQRTVAYNVAPQAVQPLFFESGAWPNVWGPQYMTRIRQVFPRRYPPAWSGPAGRLCPCPPAARSMKRSRSGPTGR